MGERLDFLTGKWIKDGPTRKRKAPEAAVGRAIDAFLKAKGAYMRTIKSDGVKQKGGGWRPSTQGKGISDRIGILPGGRFVAVELKEEGKRKTATPEQLEFLRRIVALGGVGCVADSVEVIRRALEMTTTELLADLESLTKKERLQTSLLEEPLF